MLLSIITVSFNSSKYIRQTIESVIGQTFTDLEYIIIDGGSTDGTVDIIKQYEDKVDYWTSEPDNGIADAMNKGLSVAKGDYILFLHSDDYLLNFYSIELASQHFTPKNDIFLFDIFLEKEGRRILRRPRGLNWWINFKTGVFHQSAICSKALFDSVGHFDVNFKIAMDYDIFLRAYRSGIKAKKVHMPLSVMRLNGISSRLDWPGLQERFREEKLVHFKNCPSLTAYWLYKIFWVLYIPYRKLQTIAKL